MPTAILELEEHSWNTFNRNDPKQHWVGKMNTKNRIVHMRRWLKHIPLAGVRIAAHEVEHATHADFASSRDHHDHPAWATKTGRKRHDCGRSFSVKPDGLSKAASFGLGWLHWFRTKHLSRTSIRAARRLLKDGRVEVQYEKGSKLDTSVTSKRTSKRL